MTRRRMIILVLAVTLTLAALLSLANFPWGDVVAAVFGADIVIVLAALAVNFASLVAKGWAWQLLLKPVAPVRWRNAQAATILGAAIGTVSVSVSGEAARVYEIARRDRVPIPTAISSVIWARAVEALALVLFLAVAAGLLPPSPGMTVERVALAVAIGVSAVAGWLRFGPGLVARLPRRLRAIAHPLVEVSSASRLLAPLALDFTNWITQWVTFHLVFLATGTPVSWAASLAALVASNLGGIARLTPGNIGILQASMVLAVLPFGIAPERAIAAGLVLQGIEVLPVVAAGVLIAGWSGLRRAATASARGA